MPLPPGIDDFKAYFTRDFVYGSTPDTVMDSDLVRALAEAGLVFNQSLWGPIADAQIAYLYAAAHSLVIDIQGAGGLSSTNRGLGVTNHGGGTIESKSVGGVSVNYALPDFVRQSPILSQYMQTSYGQYYLALLTPRLVANVLLIPGGSDCGIRAPILGPGQTPYGGNGIDPLYISTTSLFSASNGVPYAQQLLTTGGVSPVMWTLTAGSLPPGLLISTLGNISGTPSVAGTYLFTVTATDARGVSVTQNLEIPVA